MLSANCFSAELMELPQSAGLRPLLSEHWREIIHFDKRLLFAKIILNVGANDRRSHLGFQCHLCFTAISEGVHFLSDDVRKLADAACKKRSFFENGRTDFAVIKPVHYRANCLFDNLPAVTLIR